MRSPIEFDRSLVSHARFRTTGVGAINAESVRSGLFFQLRHVEAQALAVLRLITSSNLSYSDGAGTRRDEPADAAAVRQVEHRLEHLLDYRWNRLVGRFIRRLASTR
jgi:hypothetical protein